ncbi:Uncharacterised protein [Shigella sonnei]|nr:Uncharacterised protein [Shigella sonnei]
MRFTASRQQRKYPVMLVESTRLIRSAVRFSTVHWVNKIPALLTSAASGSSC